MNAKFLMLAILAASLLCTTAAAEVETDSLSEGYEPAKCIYLNPDDPSNPIDVFDCEESAKP